MKTLKVLLSLVSLSWFYGFSDSAFYDWLVDRFDTAWNVISWIFTFIVSTIEFLTKSIKSLFSYLSSAFMDIFWDSFVGYLSNYFDSIAMYMWWFWWVIFVVLFMITFLIMVFSFIMRLLKANVNYNATLRRLEKQEARKK